MKHKIVFRWGLGIAALAALVMGMSVTAYAADNVPYVEGGQEKTTSATPVENQTEWTDEWYVVDKDVTIGNRITVHGNVKLILADGATLTAARGITVVDYNYYDDIIDNSLTIYGQTNGTGTLNATGDFKCAGIGGNEVPDKTQKSCGTVTINGGRINATGGQYGAGIGGAIDGHGGNVVINGGNVSAKRGVDYNHYYGSGIGHGGYTENYYVLENGTLSLGSDLAVMACDYYSYPRENEPMYVDNDTFKGTFQDYDCAYIGKAVNREVTFKVEQGKWNDDTADDKSFTVKGCEATALKLPKDIIPAAGDKPDDKYTAGGWNETPSASTELTENKTFTYRYILAPVYKWADDYSSVTATFTTFDGTELTETVETTRQLITAPFCERDGEAVYTAEFTNPAFETQTEDVVLPKLGHSWGAVSYVWNADNNSVTATRVCSREPVTHKQSYVQPTTFVDDPAATCLEPGVRTYTAVFDNHEGFENVTKTVDTAPLGHDWKDVEVTWKEDFTEATVTGVCKRNNDHKLSETVKTTYEVTRPATFEEKGEGTYTATFEAQGVKPQTKTVEIPVLDPISIDKAKVVLSAPAFAYNGKVRQPAIKTIGGEALTEDVDYTAEWPDAKAVGTYTVTITGKGHYTGTTQATYQIDPKGTSLTKPKASRKAATIKWKKQSAKMTTSRITGYQIQLALNKKFTKGKKTVNVKGYKKVSKKVTGLKGGKKYYVKIRTCMKVGGKTYWSPWSKAKTVKIRK